MTTADHRTPVIVGVGHLRSNRDRNPEAARSPLDLFVDAIGRAGVDCGVPEIVARADTIGTTDVASWGYDNLPAIVGGEIGAQPTRFISGPMGGNQPGQILDDVAAAIAAGESSVAVLGGAEAVASLRAVLGTGQVPDWTPGELTRVDVSEIASDVMMRYHLGLPTRCYPLYENAFRAHRGLNFAAAQEESAQLFADFTTVAARQAAAWDPHIRTAAEIGTVTSANRMICQPYPVRMNAQIGVDQAAAVIVTSVAVAREAGIDESKWIYVRSAAGAAEPVDMLSRSSFHSSVALESSLTTALDRAGVRAADFGVLDIYSCFPVVVKFAAKVLDHPLDARLTSTGGLSAFGGPGNNYSTHGLVAVTERLRVERGLGLVYANGGMLTKHHAVVLDSQRPTEPFSGGAAPTVAQGHPPIVEPDCGTGVVETYTVEFDRDGTPTRGWVIGRTEAGERFPALITDRATLAELVRTDIEPIGRRGVISSIDAASGGDGAADATGTLTTLTLGE
ncbi:hypothetical protein GOEFS_050_00750 [Gordonia effusa NBRC 100432]|uniref:Thiolase-like protein type 1 additional C-terminal domain-containing protein n=1 Tax=Gordonia effusa NBRC 100432 TaxID=1077974 RepID=H0QZP6_9ACTN|nr:hypothetical protein [Gordonia effusa]GAB18297.1 hypothetical protein GOEFS_050_00750 [Gordonia effusa NBRC 100432]